MKQLIIESNYGDDWESTITSTGTIKQKPIYVKGEWGDSVALTLADVDRIIAARDAVLEAHRKFKERVPTEPGAYHDCDGDLWVLDREGNWCDFSAGRRVDYPPGTQPREYAPFTKLV